MKPATAFTGTPPYDHADICAYLRSEGQPLDVAAALLIEGLREQKVRLVAALRAFEERGVKVCAFSTAYEPWVGELVNARALVRELGEE